MTDFLHRNADPGFCVVCGKIARRDLCPDCWREHAPGGVFPNWLHVLVKDQNTRKQRARRAGGVEIPIGDRTDVLQAKEEITKSHI